MRAQQITRRLIALSLLSVLLTGCFSRRQETPSVGGIRTDPNEPVTLTIWRMFDDEATWKQIIDDYRRQHPNVTIEYVKKSSDTYIEDSLDALAAGTGPDIWMVRNDWMAQHYEKLIPAPAFLFENAASGKSYLQVFKEAFPDVVYEDGVIGKDIYGVPLSVDTLALYYRPGIFSDERQELLRSDDSSLANSDDFSRPPLTWSDVIRYDRLLTKKDGGRITRAGIALGATNVDRNEDILSALMLQRKTQMISADRKSATFHTSQAGASGATTVPGRDALAFWRSFSDSSSPNYTWPSDFPNSVEAFKQGKVAMIINYGYLANVLRQDAPTLEFAVGPLPQVEGETTPVDYANYWFETVTKSSKHPDVAWDFLTFASDSNAFPSAAGRPAAARPVASELPELIGERAQRGEPFNFQRASARSWYKGRRPMKVDTAVRDMIQNVVDGNGAQFAVDTAAQKITNLLQAQTPAPAAVSATTNAGASSGQ